MRERHDDDLPQAGGCPPNCGLFYIPDTINFGDPLDVTENEFIQDLMAYMAMPVEDIGPHHGLYYLIEGGPAIAHPDIVDGLV